MRTVKILMAMVVMVAAFAFTSNAQNKKEKAKKEFAEVTFTVDLHCADCQKKVEAALPYIKGVRDMKVSLEGHSIWLKYDASKTSKQVLANELLKMGYEAVEKKAEEKK